MRLSLRGPLSQSNGDYSNWLALRIWETRSLLTCSKKMQQLLSDKTEAMDLSLLKGLFIQRLPSNVRMILASTAKGSNLQELAEISDSVMEVISLSIATGATAQTTELGECKAKVASLRRQCSDLQATGQRRSNRRNRSRSRSWSQSGYVGTTDVSEIRQKMHTSTHQAGKRSGQQLGTTSIVGHIQSRLYFVTDRASRLKFVIDTGAEVSVVPCLHIHRKTQKVPACKPLTTLIFLRMALTH